MSDNVEKLNSQKAAERKKELIVRKYILLREKIIENYNKGCKILIVVKIVAAVLFVLFTVIAVALSNLEGSNKGSWLILWIVAILFDIAVFTTTDYMKHLVETKVIPYLLNDEQIEFKKYSIFSEMDDDEEEEEEEEDA